MVYLLICSELRLLILINNLCGATVLKRVIYYPITSRSTVQHNNPDCRDWRDWREERSDWWCTRVSWLTAEPGLQEPDEGPGGPASHQDHPDLSVVKVVQVSYLYIVSTHHWLHCRIKDDSWLHLQQLQLDTETCSLRLQENWLQACGEAWQGKLIK